MHGFAEEMGMVKLHHPGPRRPRNVGRPRVTLNNGHPAAAPGEADRGVKAGRACANDDDVHVYPPMSDLTPQSALFWTAAG